MPRPSFKRIVLYVVGTIVVLFLILVGIGLVEGPGEYEFKDGRGIFRDLAGRWDWTTRTHPCSDSAQVIAFSDDHKVMTITSDTPIVDSAGKDWTVVTYDILESTPSRIRGAIRGEPRKTDDSIPVVWDLIVTAQDTYQWHRTDWGRFGRTPSLARCPGPDTLPPETLPAATLPAPVQQVQARLTLPPLAEYYRGTVTNGQLGGRHLLLELSMFNRTDSTSGGWLASGPPLDLKGKTHFLATGNDSLYFVTRTPAGDTITFGSRTNKGRLEGEYWIRGGPNRGQGGSWRLDPAPRMPVVALELIAALIATLLIVVLVASAIRLRDAYWSWTERRPVTITAEQRLQWSGVGGWMLLLVVGQSLVFVMQLVRLDSVAEGLGTTWMLAAAVPWMRPLLLVEAGYHYFQMVGIVCGLVLLFRRSALTPPYWIGFLLALVAYCLGDVLTTEALRPVMLAAYPTMGSSTEAVSVAELQNFRLLILSLLWMLYWIRSRRVRVRFGPDATVSPE